MDEDGFPIGRVPAEKKKIEALAPIDHSLIEVGVGPNVKRSLERHASYAPHLGREVWVGQEALGGCSSSRGSDFVPSTVLRLGSCREEEAHPHTPAAESVNLYR